MRPFLSTDSLLLSLMLSLIVLAISQVVETTYLGTTQGSLADKTQPQVSSWRCAEQHQSVVIRQF